MDLFVFVEPFETEGSLEEYRKQFWEILQYLHEVDEIEWPAESPRDPAHHLWDFRFHGEPIFVFGNAPAYKQRKTRDLRQCDGAWFSAAPNFRGIERDGKRRNHVAGKSS